AEHLTCNQGVEGSIPFAGTITVFHYSEYLLFGLSNNMEG
ncbi:hypothetical protein SAMN04489735_10021, partial [Aneurinibacillus thermoaerophilus]